MDLPKLAGLLADLAGVAALMLSVYVFVATQRARRPRLTVSMDREKVELQYAEETWHASPPDELLVVDIANPSDRRIKVPVIWIEFAEGRALWRNDVRRDTYPYFYVTPKQPPFLLHPGDNADFATDFDEFEHWLSDKGLDGAVWVRAAIRDATGNWFRSLWLRLILS